MDPYPILAAETHCEGVVTGFIDSLFWYWSVDNSNGFVTDISDLSASKLANTTQDMEFHKLQLATHTFTDVSYIQDFPIEREEEFPTDIFEQIVKTGPVVDTTHQGAGSPRLLISFAGMLSPVVSINDAVLYAETVVKEIQPVIKQYANKGFEPLIVGNKRVLDQIDTVYETKFLPHDEYLQTLADAPCLICPPSIMSIYEAIEYEVPVIVLPEFSPSHWPDYHGLNEGISGKPFNGGVLGEYIDDFQGLSDDEIGRIFEAIEMYRNCQDAYNGAIASAFTDLTSQLQSLMDEKSRVEKMEHQKKVIESQLAQTDGARHIANDYLKRI